MWVNEEGLSYPSGESYISFGDGTDGFVSISHYGDSANIGSIYFYVGIPTDSIAIDYNEADRNIYVHYCITYNNGTMKAYKNADQIGEKEQALFVSNKNAAIARHWWYGGTETSTRFLGIIDEVRVYSKELNLSEITELFQSP